MTDRPTERPTIGEKTPRYRDNTPIVNLHKSLYFVFDLETTGRSKEKDDIFEIGCKMLDFNGIIVDNVQFQSLVRPIHPIPWYITTKVNHISNADVAHYEQFSVIGADFVNFITESISSFETEHNIIIEHYIFVAHNGRAFDMHFLFQKFQLYNVNYDALRNKSYILDTLELCRKTMKKLNMPIPPNQKLATMYHYVTDTNMGEGHQSMVDVDATIEILLYDRFWNERGNYIHRVDDNGCIISLGGSRRPPTPLPPSPIEDSETEEEILVDDNQDEINSDNEDNNILPDFTSPMMPVMLQARFNSGPDETPFAPHALQNRFANESSDRTNNAASDAPESTTDIGPNGIWEENTAYYAPNTIQRFNEAFKNYSTRRTNNDGSEITKLTIGLQCSPSSVNSPDKAWRRIMSTSILKMIVNYTNEYGNAHCEDWNEIDTTDFTDFVSVLFLGSMSRKDPPSNWFSNDPLVEFPIVKKIMTGRKFSLMLRYLHVCSMMNQPTTLDEGYDPSYKVKELLDMLLERFNKWFIPSRTLSLDETLVRSFGRIKFKVRIITRSARYGIKLYVLTDARTAYVLRVIIYTGTEPDRHTSYKEIEVENEKKTVKIVKILCHPYTGSH
jgi:DNA polymerase III epsilon subunit-like protein